MSDSHKFIKQQHNQSQCSTVVCNTVVRATIKVNGKPQILGTRKPKPLNQST